MDWPNGSETIAKMAARSPRVLLSFSRGKDSIAMWLAMRGHFEKIVPYYFYLVPGLLDFEKRSLEFYEKFFERCNNWWARSKVYVVPREQYAGN